MTRGDDTVDLGEVAAALGRGWRWLVGGTLLGLALAAVVIRFGPIRYEARATVVLRDRTEAGAGSMGIASGLGEGLADLFSLPGQAGSLVQSEVQILQSRDLLNQIVTELGLQVQVVRPRATGADALFSGIQADPAAPRGQYRFAPTATGYRVAGEGVSADVAPGETVQLPGVRLTLGAGELPESFVIRVAPRQSIVDGFVRKRRVRATVLGGDVASVAAVARDASTAARTANHLVDVYLADRLERTTRQARERLDVLETMTDSLEGELRRATGAYRAHQEALGAFDPERLGEVERAAELRGKADGLEVEARALDQVLALMASDTARPSDILAFPSFLANDAIKEILVRIVDAETRRMDLLRRRTGRDPEVMLVDSTLTFLKGELNALARSYRDGLERQLAAVGGELANYRAELASRPVQEERSYELEKEVERLTASYVGVQAQRVQARLTTIGQGADLRQVDVALPPEKPSFPVAWLTLAVGLLAGLLVGVLAALLGETLAGRVRHAHDAARATGADVITVSPETAVVVLPGEVQTVLVGPVGRGVESLEVAQSLAEAARLRDLSAEVVDAAALGGRGPEEALSVRRALAAREREGGRLVVALPADDPTRLVALLDAARTGFLVAARGRTKVAELRAATDALRRAGMTVAGVALLER